MNIRESMAKDIVEGTDFVDIARKYNDISPKEMVDMYYELLEETKEIDIYYKIPTLPMCIYEIYLGNGKPKPELKWPDLLFELESILPKILNTIKELETEIPFDCKHLIGSDGKFQINKDEDKGALNHNNPFKYKGFDFSQARNRVETKDINELLNTYYYQPSEIKGVQELLITVLSNDKVRVRDCFFYLKGAPLGNRGDLVYIIQLLIELAKLYEKDSNIVNQLNKDFIYDIMEEIYEYNNKELLTR